MAAADISVSRGKSELHRVSAAGNARPPHHFCRYVCVKAKFNSKIKFCINKKLVCKSGGGRIRATETSLADVGALRPRWVSGAVKARVKRGNLCAEQDRIGPALRVTRSSVAGRVKVATFPYGKRIRPAMAWLDRWPSMRPFLGLITELGL